MYAHTFFVCIVFCCLVIIAYSVLLGFPSPVVYVQAGVFAPPIKAVLEAHATPCFLDLLQIADFPFFGIPSFLHFALNVLPRHVHDELTFHLLT